MNFAKRVGWMACLAVVVLAWPAWCGERPEENAKSDRAVEIEPVAVELFAAVRAGQLGVAVVPHGYSVMALRVRNNTRTPLKVELPETIAAVPTARMRLVQAMQAKGVPASLANGYGYNQGPANSQGLAASLAGPWSANTPTSNHEPGDGHANDRQREQQLAKKGPQHWTLAPGEIFQTRLPAFCLEFGKPDPTSRMSYQLCALQDLNGRPAVEELLEQFARQGINQYVAQLAAWHVANDVPWQMLTHVQFPARPGNRAHRVTPMELTAAKRLAESLPSYGQAASMADQ